MSMDPNKIKRIADELYESAIEAIEELRKDSPRPDSPEGRLLKDMVDSVRDYEKARWPLGTPTAEERARFRAEQEKENGN